MHCGPAHLPGGRCVTDAAPHGLSITGYYRAGAIGAHNFVKINLVTAVLSVDTRINPRVTCATDFGRHPLGMPQPPPNPFAPHGETLDHQRLCHLLRRAALGVNPSRLHQFAGKTPEQVVDALMAYDPADDRPYSEMISGLSGLLSPVHNPDSAQEWWLMRMLDTPRPLQERVALFWHNHFATSTGKVRQAALVSRQIDLFRRLGLGDFRELLIAVGRDPAMLIWLDGNNNKKGRPNENYAREVMELFALGIGNYTEKDVQELARAFTGWQVLDETAHFMEVGHDAGSKTILGKTGKFQSESAVDLLLQQPAAPRFVAWKLLREFVHPKPEKPHVEHYAGRLTYHRWQIKPVLKEILTSRMFFSDYAYRSKIKSPCELVVGSILALDSRREIKAARQAMNNMGQALLAPPSVKGWDGEEFWINANTVLQRYNFALDLINRQLPKKVLAALEKARATTPAAVVDYFGSTLLDGRIEPAARQKLVGFVSEGGAFRLTEESVRDKVVGVVHLMMCMPEYQLA